jgi:alcohol dehydrogenase-like protein
MEDGATIDITERWLEGYQLDPDRLRAQFWDERLSGFGVVVGRSRRSFVARTYVKGTSDASPLGMKAARVRRFGPPDVIELEDIETPQPEAEGVLVQVQAAGVGPWDGWIRSGKSVLPQPLPLTLGSDLSGVVEA